MPSNTPRSTIAFAFCIASTTLISAQYPLPPAEAGNVYVSASGSSAVYCFDPTGSLLFEFEHADLRQPRGLAFSSSGELYIGSQAADRILVFDRQGDYLRQFTAEGFDSPTSLAFDADGRLYASSFASDEVFVFEDEVFSHRFGHEDLNGPNCIAIGPRDDLYVVSQLTNFVLRFEQNGEFIEKFTGGGLSSPMGAAIYDGLLYVTGGASNTVAIFDLDGDFQRNLSTNPPVSGPQGIAFHPDGDFVTTSFFTGAVVAFDRSGGIADVFDEAAILTGRSVVFEPLAVRVPQPFLRGDFNRDDVFDLSDTVAVLGFLFLGTQASDCLDAADIDDDGILQISDAIYGLTHLFSGGPAPAEPFETAGEDPTLDTLSCF